MNKAALILIDWQEAFHDSAFWGPRCNLGAEAAATDLINGWRSQGGLVWHVHHLSLAPGSPLEAGTKGADPMGFAKPKAGEPVFTKSVNSAFIGTTLEAELRQAGIERLVISGVSTDHCVSTSVRMAANLGFEVLLVGDACFTFDRQSPTGQTIPAVQVHTTNLASLNGEFARIVGVDDALGLLS